VSWSVLLALAYTAGWIPLFALRAETVYESLPHYDSRRERISVVSSVLSMSSQVTLSCVTVGNLDVIPVVPAVVSFLIFSVGLGIWFWGRFQIGPLFTRRLPEEAPRRLQTQGVFGIVRHPLFLGMLIAALAPLLLVPRLYLGVTFAACCVALSIQAVLEEKRLLLQLGAEYETYCRKVKRLVPGIW